MNKLIFIMWVSGAGKSTVLEKLLTHTNWITVNTTTTRPIRPWEINGVTYDFVDTARFNELLTQDDFIEYALVHTTSHYGTRKSLVKEAFDQWADVIKNLEIFGREKIVAQEDVRKYSYSIFMDIPDEEMIRRILERDPNCPQEEINYRLQSAQYERSQAKKLCDHYIDVLGMTREQQYDYIHQLIDQIAQE